MAVDEQKIARIWADVLGVAGVDEETNFFDLGGHSLLLAELVDRLSRELDVQVDVLTLLEYPTVRMLAAHLGAVASSLPGEGSDGANMDR